MSHFLAKSMDEYKIAELREIYNVFDKKKSDTVHISDLRAMLKALGVPTSAEEINDICREMLGTGINVVSFEQFREIYVKYADKLAELTPLRDAFKLADRDHDGYINSHDLANIMHLLGEDVTDEEAEELIRKTSLYGRDKINFEEFVVHMLSK